MLADRRHPRATRSGDRWRARGRSGWRAAAWAATLLLAGPVNAAPGDALLSADTTWLAPRGLVELGASGLAAAVDVRNRADATAQALPGNARASQLRAGWAPTERLWLTAGVGERQISHGADSYHYRSWQLAGQWRFLDAAGSRPALALRVGGWGNQASQTAATTPVTVPGAILDTVTVDHPRDRQWQADLLASWPVSPSLTVGALASVGAYRLGYDSLSATTTRNGCPYQLAFNGNDIFGTLAAPCQPPGGGGVIRQFFDSSGDYGVDVAREIAWRGRFVQAGVNARGRSGRWQWAAGLVLHQAQRDGLDGILRQRGQPGFRLNRELVLEAAWSATPTWQPFLQAQFNSNLFFQDVPVTYNSATAGSFGTRSLGFTGGLRALF
jgi:hypothetical protein